MRRDKDNYIRKTKGLWVREVKRGSTLTEDLQIVLGELCVNGGFCNALADEVLARGQPVTADGFATAVLAAEGWPDPEHEFEWRPALKTVFTHRYGDSVSSGTYVSDA